MRIEHDETPRIDDTLPDPATSFWQKDAIRAAIERDTVDASNDAAFDRQGAVGLIENNNA